MRDAHSYVVCRDVERNPVQPKLVRLEEDWHCGALRGLGELDEAIAVAKRAAVQRPDCVDLQLLRSQLLVQKERTGDAFPVLDSKDVKDQFWGNRRFLLEYMDLAYRTGNEFDAHQAMLQLRQVEAGIPDDERYVKSHSTEQLIEFLKVQREFHDDLDARIARDRHSPRLSRV